MTYQREPRRLTKWLKPAEIADPRNQQREQRIALRKAVIEDGAAWERMQAIKEEMIAGYRVPLPTTPAQVLTWFMSALVRDVLNEYETRVTQDAQSAPTLEGDDE